MFKFLHAADIHLDSPLLNLEAYEDAPVATFRSATRRALDNVVELAIAEQVRFVLIAGDLYDGDCRDFNTPRHFRRKMEELETHGIRVLVIQGNHDAESKMKKAFRLQLPDNVHLFRTDKPETIRIDDLDVAVHGQGFAQRAVEEDLSQQYPDPVRGWYNIGLLHTSCGTYEAHDRYAPSTITGLTNKGYQYWALGHIHKHEKFGGARHWIVYPGNTQGRHIREEGAKGCCVVTVDNDHNSIVSFHSTDVMRWQTCIFDASDCDSAEAVVAEAQSAVGELLQAADGRSLAVRIVVNGTTAAHAELARRADYWDRQLRVEMVDRYDDHVWVEKIKFQTRPTVDTSAWENRDDPLAELVVGIRDVPPEELALVELREEFDGLRTKLPTDPRLPDDALDLDDPLVATALFEDARELLLSRLLESGGGG